VAQFELLETDNRDAFAGEPVRSSRAKSAQPDDCDAKVRTAGGHRSRLLSATVPHSVQTIPIRATDGVLLAATLWLPEGAGPFATLLEALPYRKDDITASYADSYVRFADEGGFAVLRLDLRGTGSSGGIIDDEYTDQERVDLRTTIEWICDQPWSTGRVGMFGTSYSGFNSLHMACEGVPQLGAIAAMYATDDRFSDDVHYMGGALRALDLVDYPSYMVAMNALPPVPTEWERNGNTMPWIDEWRRRIDQTPAWVLGWIRGGVNDPQWKRGSVRLAPNGVGYERITCPTMLIAGWADGYRNNTFRTISELHRNDTPWRLLAGPWVHKDPSTARPGPNLDCDRELIAFFHEHLRGGPPASTSRAQIFVRYPTPPAPDLAMHAGIWREASEWPPADLRWQILTPSGDDASAIDTVAAHGDVGIAAWNSCGGGLPWGQPLDQRSDNARSLTYDWDHDDAAEMIGNPVVSLRLSSSARVGHVAAKLCDVAPDGTSTLITRTFLDLTQRGCFPSDSFGEVDAAPTPVEPGQWYDITLEFEATTWALLPGHRLRLAIAGTDWPNCWPPAEPFTLSVQRASVELRLPVAALPACTHDFAPGPGPSDHERDGVEWRYEHDVIRNETRVHTRYGGPYTGNDGVAIVDHYEGSLGVSTVNLADSWSLGICRFAMEWPEGSCSTSSTLSVRSDAESFQVAVSVRAELNGTVIGERSWQETLPRSITG
jgi:uncharacterized protein